MSSYVDYYTKTEICIQLITQRGICVSMASGSCSPRGNMTCLAWQTPCHAGTPEQMTLLRGAGAAQLEGWLETLQAG